MKRVHTATTGMGRLVMYVHTEELQSACRRERTGAPMDMLVYNKGAAQAVVIDDITYTMPPCSLLPLLFSRRFCFQNPAGLVAWQFNREFYCIMDPEVEVGCMSRLFYDSRRPLFVSLSGEEAGMLAIIEQQFTDECARDDAFRGDVLRVLLKYLVIMAARAAGQQSAEALHRHHEKMEVVWQYSLLVETHFKQEHEVRFYAGKLSRSPKTLANAFKLLGQSSPSRIIHDRLILEAKRYLSWTNKSVKEIGYDIGFDNPAHFSRFFKLHTGHNVLHFRKTISRQAY